MAKPRLKKMRDVDVAFLAAVRSKSVDDVKDAIQAGANPHVLEAGTRINAMVLAAERCDWAPEVVRYMFDLGVSLDAMDAKGQRPLHLFALRGATEFVVKALQMGEDANTPTAERPHDTPLMLAAPKDDTSTIRALLASGARADATNCIGMTALHFANSAETVDILVAHGADPNAVDVTPRSPLYYGIEKGHRPECLSRLLAHGADPNFIGLGLSSASYAAWKGNGQVLVMLLAAGADPTVPTQTGESLEQLWKVSRERPGTDPAGIAAYDAYLARQVMRNAIRKSCKVTTGD